MKKNYFLTLLLTLITAVSFGQTEIFNVAGGGALPTGWVGENNVTSNLIDRGSYYLLEDGSPSDVLTTSSYDLSAYATAEFKLDVASFSSGTHNQVKIEVSTNGGTTFTDLGLSNVTTGSSYIDGGTLTLSSVSNQVQLRLSNNGTTGRGIRLRNLILSGLTSNPSLNITSPTEGQVFPSTDTSVAVNITVNNFTFSADNGSGMSDGSGDGYIKQTLVTPTGTSNENKFDASAQMISVASGESYTVTMELVNNAGVSLSPAVSKTVNFSVAFPCDLQLGAITKTCDATTSGTDTYTTSIAYTGGATSTYTLNTDMGNISGNNPSTEASGTITISNIPEGTNIVFTANGDVSNSGCSLTRNISSPTCKVFPVYEPFDYTAGTNLIASADWQNNSTSSDEIQVVTGTITNPYNAGEYPDPVGNMINFAGVGSDSYISFNDATAGAIYASFLYTPTDMSTVTNTNGAYWAGLTTTTGSFVARLWVKPDATDATKFNVGVSFTGSTSDIVYHTVAYTAGDIMFMVIGYDLDTDLVSVWVNPAAGSFEAASAPAATFTKTSASATSLGRFFIRQDSNTETANTNFDELRIGSTWAQVTPKSAVASIEKNSISGFNAYPNPTDNLLTVSSFSSNKKQVTIYNVLGKKVFSTTFTGTQKTINVSNINSGIYILKVTEAGKTSTKKLVIK